MIQKACFMHVYCRLFCIGTPCISRLQKATCFDLYPDDDMILPFRMPVDGTSTIAVVNLVLKNDSKQCFTLENPSAYMQCAKH